MEEQQEFYRVIQNIPRTTRDVLRTLSFIADELRGKLSKTHDSKRTINKAQLKHQKEQLEKAKDRESAGAQGNRRAQR